MNIYIKISIILLVVFAVYQVYTTMASNKSETQGFNIIRVEKQFEIRYYPAAIMAKISSTSKSYRDLGNSGFSKLAKYIFGGNSEKKQIAMTSPVHMDIGDSISTMAFVMPSNYKMGDLPKPNSADVVIETSQPEYLAVMQFGGFANTESIDKHKTMLENALKEKGLTYYGNFRFLGYDPPYQLFGRKNEVVIALNEDQFKQ